jgi:hypothetical protein
MIPAEGAAEEALWFMALIPGVPRKFDGKAGTSSLLSA